MSRSARAALLDLERGRTRYGGDGADAKRACLAVLERRRLARADEVDRLHEALVFLQAYPDDEDLLERVDRMLAAFARRGDLRRHRAALEDTGIAGTRTRFSFYLPTALWLARRYPGRLRVDWPLFEKHADVLAHLWLLLSRPEEPAVENLDHDLRGWIERLRAPDETDAEFLVRRMAALPAHPFVQETFYDGFEIPLVIEPDDATPSRTLARRRRPRVHYQAGDLDTKRPDLARALARRPRAVRAVDRARGRALIEQAREAMAVRERDLDVFMHGDPDDVRLVDFGEGLEFAAIGTQPDRRVLLESVYGFLTLKNGVPIGYVLASALNASSEVAYNVFETYRGAEAGRVYGCVLSMVHHLLGSRAFAVDPYQLGHGNEEGLESGAWWFYYKLGYRPRDPAIRRLVRSELARMRADPGHRSDARTLTALSADYMYYFMDAPRDDVLGLLDLPNVSYGVSRYLARRFGGRREEGERVCAREVLARAGVRATTAWTPAERRALLRWSTLAMALPGSARWPRSAHRDLLRVIRAKGSRRESDFVHRMAAHAPLRRALKRLADTERD